MGLLGQRAPKLPGVKVADLQKSLALGPPCTACSPDLSPGQWGHPKSLTDRNFVAFYQQSLTIPLWKVPNKYQNHTFNS